MSDDRYVLHKKLQDLSSRSAVAVNTLKAMHLVSYTTIYDFLKSPELARPRTLQSVRLIIEFLEGACKARLLPVRRAALTERGISKEYYISDLYEKWWDNGKKFLGLFGPSVSEPPNGTNSASEPRSTAVKEVEHTTDLDAELESVLREIEQPSNEE